MKRSHDINLPGSHVRKVIRKACRVWGVPGFPPNVRVYLVDNVRARGPAARPRLGRKTIIGVARTRAQEIFLQRRYWKKFPWKRKGYTHVRERLLIHELAHIVEGILATNWNVEHGAGFRVLMMKAGVYNSYWWK